MKKLFFLLFLSITIYGQNPCPDIPTINYEGKIYNTVQIGNQCWLKENLDVGTMIQSITGGPLQTDNGIIEKYCYNDNEANCDTYGGLYEWNEAMQYTTQEGARGICPDGWHIPTFAEFEALEEAVGGSGNALKREDQGIGSGQGTNISGFSALLAGVRQPSNGAFAGEGGPGDFWSSTEHLSDIAKYLGVRYNDNIVYLFNYYKDAGFSVRCINDQVVSVEEVDIYLPERYKLLQNFPNPFNPVTTIKFTLPEIGMVNLTVYNSLGEFVTVLLNENKEVGKYTITFDGSSLTSGIYYYRLQAGNYSEVRKMVLIN